MKKRNTGRKLWSHLMASGRSQNSHHKTEMDQRKL